jgi:hypothetical protein
MVSTPARCTNHDLISTKHHIPPTIERTDDYIKERIFGNFQNFQEPRFKMSKLGFWVFSPPLGKKVNTRTNNLKVHTTSSDTHTTLVGTAALSHNIVFIDGDINVFRVGPTSVIFEKFRIMTIKQNVRGGWSGVAMGVRRSRVPLVKVNSTSAHSSRRRFSQIW